MKFFLLVFLSSMIVISAQSKRIYLDEKFNDWSNISTTHSDALGDNGSSDIDFGELKVTNDENFLFLYLEVGAEIALVEDNSITFYIDGDNNPTTGKQINGIGAELEFTFGKREGKYWSGGNSTTIRHDFLGLVISPSFFSNRFEIAIDRNAGDGENLLFTNSTIKLSFSDEAGSDKLPNSNGGVSYTFNSDQFESLPNYSISKIDLKHLRVLSYNSQRNALFDNTKNDSYSRIFKAIKPDIIGFQELYDHSAEQAKSKIESYIGGTWHAEKVGSEVMLLSKYPIKSSYSIETYTSFKNNAAFLLDLRPTYDTDLFVIVAHTKCCSGQENDGKRQVEVDRIMSFLRNAKNPGGALTLVKDTPIIIVGDMNMVGDYQQQKTLLAGDIFDNSNYGSDFLPDWDESNLEDAKPYATGLPMTFTTFVEGGSYGPSRLDYIIYSSSVIDVENSYVLHTKEMSSENLNESGLQRNDAHNASDHLPVVADFDLSGVTVIKEDIKLVDRFILEQNYPNPFNPSTKIRFAIPSLQTRPSSAGKHGVSVQLKVYDVLGKEIAILINEQKFPGVYEVEFSTSVLGKTLPSGAYFYQLRVNDFVDTKKMLLIR